MSETVMHDEEYNEENQNDVGNGDNEQHNSKNNHVSSLKHLLKLKIINLW